MGEDERIPATPEAHLAELRAKRERTRNLLERIGAAIEDWSARARLVRRLEGAGVRRPWLVITEAERAARRAEVPSREFLAMCLVVLRKETGIPQRNIYGCDYGGPVGRPRPYCNSAVTEDNAAPFIRWVLEAPFGRMNGMSWTQTTWYEKLERVLAFGKPHDPHGHLRVCFSDLALLRAAYGVGEAFERYNGSGAAAEEYRREALELLPWARNLVT